MRDVLERDGYVVTEARDGVQALDQVDRVGPDIIVLDLNLPGLDGYGVLSQLRSRPATAGIPVIVLTAKGDEDNEVRVFELGADDFLQKPFRARALSARLEAVLGRRPPAWRRSRARSAVRSCFGGRATGSRCCCCGARRAAATRDRGKRSMARSSRVRRRCRRRYASCAKRRASRRSASTISAASKDSICTAPTSSRSFPRSPR